MPSILLKRAFGVNYKLVMNDIAPIVDDTFHTKKYDGVCKARAKPNYDLVLQAIEMSRKIKSIPKRFDHITNAITNTQAIQSSIVDSDTSVQVRLELMLIQAQLDGNVLTTHYIRGACGRLFALGASLQGISKEARKIVLKGTNACDIDQQRACPTIALNTLMIAGFDVTAYTSVLNDENKKRRLKSTFGGGLEGKRARLGDNNPAQMYWNDVIQMFVSAHPKLTMAFATQESAQSSIRSWWASVLFTQESLIQVRAEQVLEEMGITTYGHIFDGSIVSCTPSDEQIEVVNHAIRTQFNIPAFQLVVKGTF